MKYLQNKSESRRGGLYIATLLSSLLVACLALAALQSVRVQRRMVDDQSEISNARNAAITGMENGANFVRSNASIWRLLTAVYHNKTTNTTGGSFMSYFVDPYDNIITDDGYDPLQLTIEGKSGTATQKATMLLYPEQRPYEACRNAIHAQGAISFNSGTTTTNQWITSNTNLVRNAGTITSDCAAAGAFNTSTGYTGIQTTNGTWPREMPITANGSSSGRISAYYDSNAVEINIEDLPQNADELLTNTGFETNTTGWTPFGPFGATFISRTTSQRYSGTASCWITISSTSAGPSQTINNTSINSGTTYAVKSWIRSTVSNAAFSYSLVVTTSTGTQTFTTTAVTPAINQWVQVTGNLTPSWTGTLTSIQLRVNCNRTGNYYFDDISLMESLAANTRCIRKVLLSNGVNPYGSGTTDPEGIYEIDANGGNLLIQDCRIRGTLLIKNATTLRITNSVNWEPAVYNYPILLTTGTLELATTNANLVESVQGVNFNPSSTPYNGTSNTNTTDNYPTVLNGLIYAAGDIQVTGNVTVNGQITTHGSINMSGPSLTVNFPSWLLHDPPPGYRPSSPTMIPAVETFQYIP